jgi:hypothetical protein
MLLIKQIFLDFEQEIAAQISERLTKGAKYCNKQKGGSMLNQPVIAHFS